MLKKVLCGTMAIGLATLLSLPELAMAFPHKANHASIQQNQLELAKKKSAKKKKKSKKSKKTQPAMQSQQQPLFQGQQSLA